jgi:hypothetical protein
MSIFEPLKYKQFMAEETKTENTGVAEATAPTTIYWSPTEQVTITGVELASLIQLVDLQTVAINQVPLITLFEIYCQATSAKNAIMERLAQEGKLSSQPVEATPAVNDQITDAVTQLTPINETLETNPPESLL